MIETQTLPAEIPQTLSFTTTSKSSIATTILLVEDEALVRQVTADILEFHGYRVLTARNAQEATAKFHRNEGIVQLLITDVVLPGQHGLDLACKLKSEYASLRVIFVSGFPENAWTRQGQIEPDTLYLPKPFSAESLLKAVEEILQPTAEKVAI